MPIPPAVARFNKAVLNRLTTPVAAHLPGFAVVHHHGRRSGRAFRTPVNLFPVEGGFVVALTYGSRADWVRNVLAAGACTVQTRGRLVPCVAPRLYRDPDRRGIRPVGRAVLGLLGVEEFLALRTG